ncbi:hypothetical protein HanPI659440_Chr17g0698421 [Helianthus annuus]|nr:hypothetical protein HanPI659440_Chr17g0698421 [Helianthus annuus]
MKYEPNNHDRNSSNSSTLPAISFSRLFLSTHSRAPSDSFTSFGSSFNRLTPLLDLVNTLNLVPGCNFFFNHLLLAVFSWINNNN